VGIRQGGYSPPKKESWDLLPREARECIPAQKLSTVFSHYRRVGPDIACVPLRLCQPPSLRVVKTKLYCREKLLQTSALRSLWSLLQRNFLRGLALKSPVAKRKTSEIQNNFSVKTREALLWSWPRVALPCTFATRNSRMPFDEDKMRFSDLSQRSNFIICVCRQQPLLYTLVKSCGRHLWVSSRLRQFFEFSWINWGSNYDIHRECNHLKATQSRPS